MIFFEPRDLIDFSNGKRRVSLGRLLLGKRVEGVGGNSAAHRWLSRIETEEAEAKDEALAKFMSLISANTGIASSKFDKMLVAGPVSLLNNSPWCAFTHGVNASVGGNLSNRLPRTIHLVTRLDVLSKIGKHYAEVNDRDALSQIVSDLPLSSSFVPDWICERLKTGNDKNWDAIFFPLRVILLFATLRHMSEEASEADDPSRADLSQVFLSRDKNSGNPRPFRPCFERLLEITGENTFDDLFKKVFGGAAQTRIREGRKFLAAPPHEPKTKACSALVRSAEKAYPLDPNAVKEIETMFFFARMVTGIYIRCREHVGDLPGIDPNAIMDEWGVAWRLEKTEDVNILRQMDAIMSQLYSVSD